MASCFVHKLDAIARPRRWVWVCAICNREAGVERDHPGRVRLSCRRCGSTETHETPIERKVA